jgi:hypothetical protein
MILPSDEIEPEARVPSHGWSGSAAERELVDLLGRLLARHWVQTGGKLDTPQVSQPGCRRRNHGPDPISDPRP